MAFPSVSLQTLRMQPLSSSSAPSLFSEPGTSVTAAAHSISREILPTISSSSSSKLLTDLSTSALSQEALLPYSTTSRTSSCAEAIQLSTPSLGDETKSAFGKNIILGMLAGTLLIASFKSGISGLSSEDSPSYLEEISDSIGRTAGSIVTLIVGYFLSTLAAPLFTDVHSPELRERFSETRPNTCGKITRVATRIPRLLLSTALDVVVLPFAGVLLAIAPCFHQSNLDSDQIKKERTPILLLHGSGFNQMEWVVGLLYLRCCDQDIGSVFTLDYAGVVSNEEERGIEDYAGKEIKKKLCEIQEKTGQNEVILIGHSLGGLIGPYVAEYTVKDPSWKNPITVPLVITVAAPWQGTPLLNMNLFKPKNSRRHSEMSEADPTQVRLQLVKKALASHRNGSTKYFTISSTTDLMVPGVSALLHGEEKWQYVSTCLNHYSLIIAPQTWLQIRSVLKQHEQGRQNKQITAKTKG